MRQVRQPRWLQCRRRDDSCRTNEVGELPWRGAGCDQAVGHADGLEASLLREVNGPGSCVALRRML